MLNTRLGLHSSSPAAKLFLVLLLLQLSLPAVAQELQLVYPRNLNRLGELIVPAVDSMFTLGSVSPEVSALRINDEPVKLFAGGRWLHWLERGDRLHFTLYGPADTVKVLYHLGVADIVQAVELPPADRLRIERPGCSIKTAPKGTYFAFPQPGTLFEVIDTEDNLYHVRFGDNREGWIRPAFATPVEHPLPPADVIHRLDLQETTEGLVLQLPVALQLVLEQLSADRRRLRLTLTNAISDIDVIRYPPQLARLLQLSWQQTGSREVVLTCELTTDRILGYQLVWGEEGCRVELRLQSHFAGNFWNILKPGKGWTVMLDPGHGGEEEGAIGPGGLTEQAANLELARLLRRRLERKGFEVLLTREQDQQVGLAERVQLAQSADATLFVSLHFNSIAQGSDPRRAGGSSLYWYYPQAAGLALALHKPLLQRLQLGDDGLYYRNLAVLRNSWMPAVLVEGAYIIQPASEVELVEGDLLQREAAAICQGIVKYRRSLKRTL